MDYSTMSAQSGLFGNSLFANSTATTQGTPDKNKETRFRNWHDKQGITTPQDYSTFASQPAPFSSVPQNPNQPTAASPYLQKVLTQQAVNSMNGGSGQSGDLFGADIPDGRRKPPTKRTSSSPPSSAAGAWPKSMFGTRPPSRTRARTSSTPDMGADFASSEDNAPPLASIYDSFAVDPPTNDSKLTSEPAMTPTQVKVANFSEDRFPDLIRSLRRYYGPILEPYSGLPESESKFSDPDIIPRSQLDYATSRMVQPMSGSDGGPGPWVRITFRDREAAERAVEGAGKRELMVGGRVVLITLWENQPIASKVGGLPFSQMMMMEMDQTPLARSNNGVHHPGRVGSFSGDSAVGRRRPSTTGAGTFEDSNPVAEANGESEFMPGAKVVVPRQVEFAKKDGWLSGWTNSLSMAGGKSPVTGGPLPPSQQGWGSTVWRIYRYVMDEVVGFKYL